MQMILQELRGGLPAVILRCPQPCFLKSHSRENRERRTWVIGNNAVLMQWVFPVQMRWGAAACTLKRRKELTKTGFSSREIYWLICLKTPQVVLDVDFSFFVAVHQKRLFSLSPTLHSNMPCRSFKGLDGSNKTLAILVPSKVQSVPVTGLTKAEWANCYSQASQMHNLLKWVRISRTAWKTRDC